ncbi:MAG: hypothetical protein PHG66_00330 [Candidatus Colwellbacteria bacterium]|nr:hypothetical protein [Candidatus Colwellbacteria bacterium]
MATPFGVLDSYISVLISEVGRLNKPKIDANVFTMYSEFLQVVKSIAKTITEIQRDMKTAKPKKREKFTPVIDSVITSLKQTVNKLIKKIDKIVEKSQLKKYDDVDEERKFLDVMTTQLRTTGEINSELLSKINSTQNHALDRYLISILSSQNRSNKYPWTYYVPTITDLKDRLLDVYINNNENKPDEIKKKYVHNFLIMIKQVYYMTKTNVRNISMIRLSDLNDGSSQFIKYKRILENLLFTLVDNEFVPGDYSSLMGTYTSHTNSLSRLLGGDTYKKLIYRIVNDGRSFLDKEGNPTKTTKTETLIKYILIAIQKVTYSNVDQHTKFFDTIVSFVEKVLEANANIADLSSIVELSDKEFNRSDLSTRHNRLNNVFTFVKIRADKVGSLVETNQRYRIGLDQERQIMYMGYEPTPESIYDQTMTLENKYKYLASNENLLPNNYLFGPFTYIFKPSDDNSVISNHKSMTPLLDNIKNGKSVCVIGYGASGSGKTTSLVYADFEQTQEKRNGILIHFCNMLRDTYGEIEVSFLELEGNIREDGKDAISNFKILPIPLGDEKQLNEDKSFKYTDDDKQRQSYYSERIFSIDPESGEWILSQDSGLDEIDGVSLTKGVGIGKYIVTIMEGKRSIQATTNNPVSSRSHMIIFVKFKNKKSDVAQEKEPYLIICDFAGVENKFQCNNEEVLSMFENIKSQTKCKDKNSSKRQCKEFENFYDVHSKIQEIRDSEDARYSPEPITEVNIPDGYKKAIVFTITNSDQERENLIKILEDVDPILIKVLKSSYRNEFIYSLKQLKRFILSNQASPSEITKYISSNNLEIDEWLKELWSIFGIDLSKSKNITVKRKVGGISFTIERSQFINELYLKDLRADKYDENYVTVFKNKPAGRAMTSEFLKKVDEMTAPTLYSPVLNCIDQYIKIVFKEFDLATQKNKTIKDKISKRENILESSNTTRVQLLSQICNSRVKEGLFINDSLRYLRNFISHFVTGIQNNNGKIVNPKFVDECAPIQCNPNYEDCFGNTTVLEKNINESSVIANEIRKRLCCVDKDNKVKIGCKPMVTCEDFKEVTFCIFNVINLTKKTNNPPPIPHIDLSNLMMELSRLESLKTMLVMDEYKINDDMTSSYVHPVYLDEIKTSNLLSDKMPGSLKGDDKKLILDIITILEGYHDNPPDVNTTINALKLLINTINMTNSLSLIGTLEFTDMISKFGLNRTTCNYKYQEIVALPKLKGKDLEEFKVSVAEYKSFILNLHSKYNEGIIES